MKISCVAIDDEPLALDLLSKFIQQTTFLELVGKFSNAIEALGYINQHEVNLIFMDIQMPDLPYCLKLKVVGAHGKRV